MFARIAIFRSMSSLVLGMLLASHPAWADQRITGIQKEVVKRDRLRCGASPTLKLEQLYCRAVAAAVLGDATKVDLITLTQANRWQAVRHDPAVNPNVWVDVSFYSNTASVGRDGDGQGMTFTSPIYMANTAVMGRISSASGQSVLSDPSAFMAITTTAHLAAYSVANPGDKICASLGTNFKTGLVAIGVPAASVNQPAAGLTGYTGDNGGANGVPCHAVVSNSLSLTANTANRENFEANISLDHSFYAGATRQVKRLEVNGTSLQADKGDQRWDALVNAVVNGVQMAALYGVDRSNVTGMCNLSTPVPHDNVAQLLGISASPPAGPTVGLRNNWACDVIAQVGNHDEFWDAMQADVFATSGAILDQTTFYNGFNQLYQDPSGRPTGGLIVPIGVSAS